MNASPDPATVSHMIWDSPVGPLGLVAWNDKLSGIFLRADRKRFAHQVELTYGTAGQETKAPFADVIRQLTEYFGGKRLVFKLPLDLDQGTPFQRKVWRALLDIPYGRTVTYKEIAESIGQPSASRAVGGANGSNPIPIVIPCHRVVASGNKLGGYGGGLDVKRRLLELESNTRMEVSKFGLGGGEGKSRRTRRR
jgi:methylated-DNA-[protein]-cysteine S-methyltransferase